MYDQGKEAVIIDSATHKWENLLYYHAEYFLTFGHTMNLNVTDELMIDEWATPPGTDPSQIPTSLFHF